jgi:hypothetical protein
VILERLAVSVAMVESRRGPENALEIVVDPERSADERAAALARLRIRAGDHLRLIATAVDAAAPAGPSVVMATKYGPLRATVVRAGDVAVSGRAGLGPTVVALRAPASWEAAMVGLRLSSEKDPVVDGSDLGAMVLLARWADPAVPHPDVVTLEKLDPHNHEILRALVETDSVRAAAARLAMHHSTVQARLQSLVRMLGFDPRTALGRMRYIAANPLLRLRHPQP